MKLLTQCTSCGTRFDDAVWDRGVGVLRLILMPLRTRPVGLIRYGTYWGDTSDLDCSVADEEFLKHVTRELWLPDFTFLMKTFRGIFQVALDTLVIGGVLEYV